MKDSNFEAPQENADSQEAIRDALATQVVNFAKTQGLKGFKEDSSGVRRMVNFILANDALMTLEKAEMRLKKRDGLPDTDSQLAMFNTIRGALKWYQDELAAAAERAKAKVVVDKEGFVAGLAANDSEVKRRMTEGNKDAGISA